jgi:hypothetical protein
VENQGLGNGAIIGIKQKLPAPLHLNSMLLSKSWSPRQWCWQLDQAQLTASVLIDGIKERLERF